MSTVERLLASLFYLPEMSDTRITTKPGDKYRSLKWPALYEKLRARGYSKEQAARISNAQARKRKKDVYPDQRQFAGYTMEDWDDTKPDSFYHAQKDATFDDLERVALKGYSQAIVDAIASLVPVLPRFKGEQLAPGITRIRGNLCNVHGRYGRCPGAPTTAPKPAATKPKKGRAARKPAKTPEQRAAEQDAKKREREQDREAERTQADAEKRATRDKLLSDAGLDNQTRDALVDARAGDTLAPINGQKLAGMGLAEQASDGSYRLTAAGRETVNAALRGDAGRVNDTISAARDAAAKRGAAKPEKQPKGGGGGGKGKPEAKPAKQTDTRAQIVRDAAQRARAAEQGLERRRREDAQRARQQAQDTTRTRRQTEQDRQRQAREQAAVERSRVTTPQLASAAQQLSEGQELSGATADALVRNGLARRDRDGNLTLTATGLRATRQKDTSSSSSSSFAVFKDATGRDRWLSVTTTAYQDRDREWISRKAIVGAVEAGDATGQRGPLRFWHVPGLDLGTCDYQATAQDGRFLIESGTFKHAAAARVGQAAAAKNYQMSPGFVHPADEPRGGVFDHITIFERSIVPAGRASNPFTRLVTKGTRMLTDEKKKEFEALAGDAESRAFLSDLLSTVQTTDKAAQESATYKDAPDWAQALIGRIEALETSLKAAPEMVAEEQPVVEVETKVDEELMVEEEPVGGLTLSPEDIAAIGEAFAAQLAPALAQVMGALDLEKKVAGHVQSLMTPYQTTKDAQDAERAQEIATLKEATAELLTSLQNAQKRLAELEGETPAAYKGHRITDNPIVSEARNEQLIPTPPMAADFDPIVAQLAGNGVKLPGT